MKNSILSFFMLGFLGAGFAASLPAVTTSYQNMAHHDFSHVIRGDYMKDFEKSFNKSIPFYNDALKLFSFIDYSLFRQGDKGVIAGNDGWLFTGEEFYVPPRNSDYENTNRQFIQNTVTKLSQDNIKVVITPVPAKIRMYRNKIDPKIYPSYKDNIYPGFVKWLLQENIEFCSLEEMYQTDKSDAFFLKTDTHWTPEGAAFAARKIAWCLYRTNKNIPPHGAVQSHQGDLTRYINIGGIAPERYGSYQYETGDASGDLFGDASSDITLVGTSYSANPLWQFKPALEYYTGKTVLNAAEEGEGPFEAMTRYLENDSFRQSPPKLVLWEIPERYLSMPVQRTKHD